MNKKGYEVNISENRFLELSTNPKTGKFNQKSIFETEEGLELEVWLIICDVQRIQKLILILWLSYWLGRNYFY